MPLPMYHGDCGIPVLWRLGKAQRPYSLLTSCDTMLADGSHPISGSLVEPLECPSCGRSVSIGQLKPKPESALS